MGGEVPHIHWCGLLPEIQKPSVLTREIVMDEGWILILPLFGCKGLWHGLDPGNR